MSHINLIKSHLLNSMLRKFEIVNNDVAVLPSIVIFPASSLDRTLNFYSHCIQTFNFVRKSPHLSKFGGFLSHSLFKLWYIITISFNDAMFFCNAENVFFRLIR